MHKHMYYVECKYGSIDADARVDTMEADCKIFKAVGGYNTQWPSLYNTLYNSIQSAECVCHVHSFI